MKLSEELQDSYDCGDHGPGLESYPEKARALEAELDAANAHIAELREAISDFSGDTGTEHYFERLLAKTPAQSLASIEAKAIHNLRQQGYEFSVEYRFTDKWAISTDDIDAYANKLIEDNK